MQVSSQLHDTDDPSCCNGGGRVAEWSFHCPWKAPRWEGSIKYLFIYLIFFAHLPSLGVLACLDGYMNIALEQTEEYANGQVRITVRDQLDESKKVVFQGCCYIFSYC